MSRTNTAAYESIKASQLVFQNPDRSFPEPGTVLTIDNSKGATTWSKNLDIDSLALSGASTVGVLTYENQLLVNGVPVGGGGGADISGGSNIAVELSGGVQVVSLAVREDIDMCSNSILNCKTIELPRIPNTSSAKITFGSLTDSAYGIISYEDVNHTLLVSSDTNVEVRGSAGVTTVGAEGILDETYLGKSITGIVKTGYFKKVSAMELNADNTFIIGATDISGIAPTLAFQTDISQGSITFNGSGEMRLSAESYAFNDVSAGSYPNILGYDVSSGKITYQPTGGGSDLSGGYNISVGGGSINMDIVQPVLMNNNPIVGASYVDIIGEEDSVKLTYDATNVHGLSSSRNIRIYNSNLTIPSLQLSHMNGLQGGYLIYDSITDLLSTLGNAVSLKSTSTTGGSININSTGLSINSLSNPIQMNIIISQQPISAAMLTTQNELQVGSIDISTNPALILQGSNTNSRIEYDVSGELRFTSNNYAFNAVPTAVSSLPTVLGYNSATGEIKAQTATNGISALSSYTYDASGSLNASNNIELLPYAPDTTGVYMINFYIEITNNNITPLTFNNTTDSIYLAIGAGADILFPPLVITGIQNRLTTDSAHTFTYSVTKLEVLQALTDGRSYTFTIFNENRSGTCAWASCIPRVRIVKLC